MIAHMQEWRKSEVQEVLGGAEVETQNFLLLLQGLRLFVFLQNGGYLCFEFQGGGWTWLRVRIRGALLGQG